MRKKLFHLLSYGTALVLTLCAAWQAPLAVSAQRTAEATVREADGAGDSGDETGAHEAVGADDSGSAANARAADDVGDSGSAAVVSSGTPVYTADGSRDYAAEAEARRAEPIESNETPGWPQGPAVGAEGAVLMEADTGAVLYNKNMHEKLYPASTTKLLTALLAAENIAPDETVTFSHEAVFSVPKDGSSVGIDEGETLTREECLYAIMVGSANEVCNAVAEKVGGSVEGFVEMMNERAAQLGCTDSHFANANGLFAEDHYTSAHDLALIARAFFANDTLLRIGNTPVHHFTPTATQPDDFWVSNGHELITGEIPCEGVIGGKTGYTDPSRRTLVTGCERDGMRLICVVMKEEAPAQFNDTVRLFNYGYDSFQKVRASDYETRYTVSAGDFTTSGGDLFGDSAPAFSVSEDSALVLPNTLSFGDLTSEVTVADEDAPRNENGAIPIAKLTYSYGGVPLGSADLYMTKTANTADGAGGASDGTGGTPEGTDNAAGAPEHSGGGTSASDTPRTRAGSLAVRAALARAAADAPDATLGDKANALWLSARCAAASFLTIAARDDNGTLYINVRSLLLLLILAAAAVIAVLMGHAVSDTYYHERSEDKKRRRRRRRSRTVNLSRYQ